MNSSLATFAKLVLTFVSTFGVAFAGISIALQEQTGIQLNWSILSNDLITVQKQITEKSENAMHNLLNEANAVAKIALQQKKKETPKTLIYTAHIASAKKQSDTTSSITDPETDVPSETILSGNIENFVYYNQHDERWKDHLYGGNDPIDKYGCGPTTLAMIVGNLSKKSMTPTECADWAAKNGYYAKGGGSYHGILKDGANAFGLDSSAFKQYSADALRKELKKGNVFAALMKKGTFSKSTGHFILILGLDENGNAIIADANSEENTQKTWQLETLIKELKLGASAGGPLWKIRLK